MGGPGRGGGGGPRKKIPPPTPPETETGFIWKLALVFISKDLAKYFLTKIHKPASK